MKFAYNKGMPKECYQTTQPNNLNTSNDGIDTNMRLLNRKEVATLLGVSIRTIDRLVTSRKLSYIKICPRTIRFRIEDCEEFIVNNYVGIEDNNC